MLAFLVDGLLAGFGIAMPVGAVSILIVTAGMKDGFRTGFMAGAGAATADLVYAALASVAGSALARLLAPVALPIRLTGGVALVALAALGIWRGLRGAGTASADAGTDPAADRRADGRAAPLATYARLLAITLVNPLTVVYFAAIVLGTEPAAAQPAGGRALFVLGAGAASLSWQSLLAAVGGFAHGRLGPRFRRFAALVGNLVVAALGARIIVLALSRA
jgi:threonine/homoserine/homoserine lactone efflux protein